MKELKKFDEVIQVEVAVDQIAEKLLSTFDKEQKHSVLITETIIGTMLNEKSLTSISMLYSALNGYTNEIDFEVGDEVLCSEKSYQYIKDVNNNELKEVNVEIGYCKVVKVDLYSNKKLTVEYQFTNYKGDTLLRKTEVNHKNCNKIITYNEDEKIIGIKV